MCLIYFFTVNFFFQFFYILHSIVFSPSISTFFLSLLSKSRLFYFVLFINVVILCKASISPLFIQPLTSIFLILSFILFFYTLSSIAPFLFTSSSSLRLLNRRPLFSLTLFIQLLNLIPTYISSLFLLLNISISLHFTFYCSISLSVRVSLPVSFIFTVLLFTIAFSLFIFSCKA